MTNVTDAGASWPAGRGVEAAIPDVHELVDGDHAFETLATGYGITEGPVWHPLEHYLLFTDLRQDVIRRLDGERITEFRRPTNISNGLTRDRELRLLACEHVTSRVTRTDTDGSIQTVASHHEGRELNSPNDIVVSSTGDIYFTDPPYGRTPVNGVERPQELPFQGVFRVPDGAHPPQVVADDFDRPNGLCLSLDESVLYVNDTARMHIRAFDIGADGTLFGGRIFFQFAGTGEIKDGVPDGMKIDEAGNVYCTGPAGIWLISPAGAHLGTLRTPFRPTNFTWGGADGRDLFVTGVGGICRGRTRVRGATGL